MPYYWEDERGSILRVAEDGQQKRLQVQIEFQGGGATFHFDTPGDFGDFVAVLTDLAKTTFDLDFAKILNQR
ncbi:MAG: hypothetical protein AB7U82_27590 [Blastocatellales bacterium]